MADIPNRKSFGVTTGKKTSFNIFPFGIKKSFEIILNKKSSFGLVIFGFNMIDKYIVSPSMTLNLALASNLRKVVSVVVPTTLGVIYILKQRLALQFSETAMLRLTALVSEVKRLSFDSINSGLQMSIDNYLSSYSSSAYSSSLSLLVSPEVRVYYTLGAHDTKTLAEMDVLTLAELDYNIV